MPILVADLPQSAGHLGVVDGQALEGLAKDQLADGLVSSPDAKGLVNGSGNDQVAEVDHTVDRQLSVKFVFAGAAGFHSTIKGALWSTASAFRVLL